MVAVSYNNLWKLLIDKGMNKTELKEASGISFNVMARIGKTDTMYESADQSGVESEEEATEEKPAA